MREGERRSRPMARKLRNTMTKAETVLWTALKNRAIDGWKFRRQHPIGPYIADFVCVEGKLIVEVDGATHADDREIEHDARRTKHLEREGYTVLRVTNLGVYEDLDGVVRSITAALAPLGPRLEAGVHSPRTRGETSRRRSKTPSPARGRGVGEADGGGCATPQAPNPGRTPL